MRLFRQRHAATQIVRSLPVRAKILATMTDLASFGVLSIATAGLASAATGGTCYSTEQAG
jgi:hypothetical protein